MCLLCTCDGLEFRTRGIVMCLLLFRPVIVRIHWSHQGIYLPEVLLLICKLFNRVDLSLCSATCPTMRSWFKMMKIWCNCIEFVMGGTFPVSLSFDWFELYPFLLGGVDCFAFVLTEGVRCGSHEIRFFPACANSESCSLQAIVLHLCFHTRIIVKFEVQVDINLFYISCSRFASKLLPLWYFSLIYIDI